VIGEMVMDEVLICTKFVHMLMMLVIVSSVLILWKCIFFMVVLCIEVLVMVSRSKVARVSLWMRG